MIGRIAMRPIRRLWKVRRRFLPVPRGALILAYHRVVDPRTAPAGDPWNNCVAPDRFAAHMEVVAGLKCAVPLEEIADVMSAGEPPGRRIAVTFDDGYLDNLTHALPVLEQHDIPATVFFVAGNQGGVFWWDSLAALLELADPTIPFRLHGAGWSFEWRANGTARKLHGRLHRIVGVLERGERTAVLEELAATWKLDQPEGLPRAMNDREAQALVCSGLVEPGGHTVDHPPLGEIAPARARTEIETGRRLLKERFRRPINTFAYPYSSAGPRTAHIVREAGYRLGCLTSNAPLRSNTDRFRVPRIWVGSHWTKKELRERIGRYLVGGAG